MIRRNSWLCPCRRSAGPLRQRGAIGMFGVLVFLLAVMFMALAVDTGRLALEKRKLQKIADIAALQAVQTSGLCSGVDSMDPGSIQAAAQASAAANGYHGNLASETGAVTIGTVATDGAGIRQFTASDVAQADAVQISARANVVKSLIAGGMFAGTVPLHAVAIAQRRQPTAGFSLGSFLVSVNSGDVDVLNQVMGGLLGSGVALQLVSYQGLASAQVTLGGLVQGAQLAGISLTAATVQGLLDAQVSIADLINIMVHAVDSSDPAYAALNQLLVAAGGNAGTFRLGDLIQVTATDPQSAQGAVINVGTLLTAGMQMADQHHAISIPITMSLPAGVGSAQLSLAVIEPPVIAIGPPGRDEAGNWRTQAHTAQVRFSVDTTLNVAVSGVTVTGNFGLAGEVARADGYLQSIRCASMADPGNHVTIGVATAPAAVSLGSYPDIANSNAVASSPALTITFTDLGLLVTTTASVAANAFATGMAAQEVAFDNDAAHPLPLKASVGSDVDTALANAIQSVSDSLTVTVTPVAGLPVGAATLGQTITQSILAPTLTALDTGLLSPLLRALGINIGGADVELLEVNDAAAQLLI